MFKILVVEDDRELNRTVCAYLGGAGYTAVGCLNAGEAYDAMYGGQIFDCIVSDIMMPGVDGFEFAGTVRRLDQEIPILFMTARDDFAAKRRGFRAGVDDYSLLFPHPAVVLLCAAVAGLGISMAVQAARRGKR